jgi:phosphoserine phosphatase RsbU/P
MDQRKLYRTIESIASEKFENQEDLLKHVLSQIVDIKEIQFTGGRIWKLTPNKKSYRLIFQIGDIEKIQDGYSVRISEYPVFNQIGKQKTLSAKETDKYLRKKGIIKYSLTGVGDRIKMEGNLLFQYLLAFNIPPEQEDNSLYTLNIIGSAVTSVLRTTKAEAKTKQLEKDLDKAREIQKSILPDHSLHFGNYDIFGVSLAEQVVGGDFFDYIEEEDEKDRVTVVIGDAASKGLSAAIQALYVSGAMRMGLKFRIKISSLLRNLNNLVNRMFPNDRFVTLFIADLIDNKKGLCVFGNAGHNAPLFYNHSTGIVEFLLATGTALGISPDQSYRIENINLYPGDILLLYTDGISEAMNSDYELFGEERLSKLLIENKDLSSKELCQKILQSALDFSQRTPYSDDKTVVAIKRVK